MIVDDLDIVGVPVFPREADSPLIVDPDAPRALSISGQRFQPVPGRNPKIFETFRRIQKQQFSASGPFNRLEASNRLVEE